MKLFKDLWKWLVSDYREKEEEVTSEYICCKCNKELPYPDIPERRQKKERRKD